MNLRRAMTQEELEYKETEWKSKSYYNNKAVYFTKMVRQVYSFANSNLKISGPAEGFSVYNPFLTCCTYSDLIQESR